MYILIYAPVGAVPPCPYNNSHLLRAGTFALLVLFDLPAAWSAGVLSFALPE